MATLLSAFILTLPLAATTAETAPLNMDPQRLEIAFIYRNWLQALERGEWEKAAAAVAPQDLVALKERALDQIRRSRPGRRLYLRMFNLGVESIEDIEAMTPVEFFGAVVNSGGGPFPNFLRAATVQVIDGGIEGDRGWLDVRMRVTAKEGEVSKEQELRQQFLRIEDTWYVSLRPSDPPRTPESGEAETAPVSVPDDETPSTGR